MMSQPWIAELMVEHLDTGERADAPDHVWRTVAAATAVSDAQAALFTTLDTWWLRATGAINAARREISRRALEAPGDLALQASAVDALEAAQGRYLSLAAAALVVGLTGILRVEQTAELWVTCLSFGFMPVMSGLLVHLASPRR
ncbi:MAG: hypothetical protein J3K34DRAFT_442221 [Monoraphidium minutum]|nr:MAG: hypothetical protein J3K34DRAFT_442221 [Monoraphidium minutum]